MAVNIEGAPSQEAKADVGKTDPLLLEHDMVRALSVINRVLDYGMLKYERRSWMKVAADRWNSACRRHRRSRDTGQMFDDESGLLHIAHEAAGLIIQLELFIQQNPQYDYLSFREPPQEHKRTSK
ncbi:hypothetical protein SAMN05216227_102061 [Pseudorhodobacter antarcticus]|uniref:dATP/dGTP diphosphohydrolase N-terminal domain-containing protein n=1 Tax=Pseudorhodobacter antarcticus TaxID=1077947 RepID=A0A1H8IJU3_9RHOB|nr:dATP/dGTP diphosphohydrolase domain-containing protein [Pseudorhodobacter antarcticus]SEN68539.1 hypothetical protein SAMN05216227_102061 [Pseudorhodobacter antarcticus]